jgi:hypothetical protein
MTANLAILPVLACYRLVKTGLMPAGVTSEARSAI